MLWVRYKMSDIWQPLLICKLYTANSFWQVANRFFVCRQPFLHATNRFFVCRQPFLYAANRSFKAEGEGGLCLDVIVLKLHREH